MATSKARASWRPAADAGSLFSALSGLRAVRENQGPSAILFRCARPSESRRHPKSPRPLPEFDNGGAWKRSSQAVHFLQRPLVEMHAVTPPPTPTASPCLACMHACAPDSTAREPLHHQQQHASTGQPRALSSTTHAQHKRREGAPPCTYTHTCYSRASCSTSLSYTTASQVVKSEFSSLNTQAAAR